MLSAFRPNAKPSTSTISVILWGLCPSRNGCSCSVTKLCLTFCDPVGCNTPGLSDPHYLLEFAQTHLHWVSDTIQPSHSLLPHSPPALNLSQHQGLFQWVSSLPSGGKSTSASVLPMNSQDWLPLGLAGLLSLQSKGLSKVFSTFFMVQLSQPYMTTGKTIALTIQTFVNKVMSLLFNILCRFVIAFLSNSKHLLISWLQSLSLWFYNPRK